MGPDNAASNAKCRFLGVCSTLVGDHHLCPHVTVIERPGELTITCSHCGIRKTKVVMQSCQD